MTPPVDTAALRALAAGWKAAYDAPTLAAERPRFYLAQAIETVRALCDALDAARAVQPCGHTVAIMQTETVGSKPPQTWCMLCRARQEAAEAQAEVARLRAERGTVAAAYDLGPEERAVCIVCRGTGPDREAVAHREGCPYTTSKAGAP